SSPGTPGAWRGLLANTPRQRVIAWREGQAVTVARFLADVGGLAARLPAARAAVNLCEDRYAFLVAFAALLVRGQTNLLPPSRAAHAVDAVLAAHPGSYALGDVALDPAPPQYLHFTTDVETPPTHAPVLIAGGVPAAIGYTSGSTGVPRANPKCWEKLAISSSHNDALLRALAGGDYHVVATVPPQHMYGLEFSVLLPLFGHAAIHAGRPFFAADIAGAGGPARAAGTGNHARASARVARFEPVIAGFFRHRFGHRAVVAATRTRRRSALQCTGAGGIRLHRNLRDRASPHRAGRNLDALSRRHVAP